MLPVIQSFLWNNIQILAMHKNIIFNDTISLARTRENSLCIA